MVTQPGLLKKQTRKALIDSWFIFKSVYEQYHGTKPPKFGYHPSYRSNSLSNLVREKEGLNYSLDTLEKIADSMGLKVTITFTSKH